MDSFLQATLKANEEIYQALQKGAMDDWYTYGDVGVGGDRSSGLDLFAERIFYKHLSKFGSIESEESGIMNVGEAKIIIDPIDGSDNALSKFPYFGTSVAYIEKNGKLKYAMVCNLSTAEVFWSISGEAPMHGKLFSDMWEVTLENSFSKVGLFERAYDNPKIVQAFKENSIKFRSPGAIALSLAYARWVDFVLFIGPIRVYDVAAGLALCEGLEVIIQEDFAIVAKEKSICDKIFCIVSSCFDEESK